MRQCGNEGLHTGYVTTLYDVTAQECLIECQGNTHCDKAHHHPGYQIWENDGRSNCWLWSSISTPCNWNGGERVQPSGATMIRCQHGKWIMKSLSTSYKDCNQLGVVTNLDVTNSESGL